MLDAAAMDGIPRAVSDDFDRVVRERQAAVLRTAYRILGNWADAEDVAQEAFVRLHRHGLGFTNDAVLGAWLYRVAVNLCLDRARAARPRPPAPTELLACAVPSAEAAAIQREQQERVMAALAKLPARERAAVVLREIEGLSTAEVAAILGTAEPTVRSQVSKAIVRLRAILTGEQR